MITKALSLVGQNVENNINPLPPNDSLYIYIYVYIYVVPHR